MSTQEQAIVKQETPIETNALVGFGSSASFELMQRGAKLLAASTLVPKEYQGNLPNCVIALNMATRIGADPLMVMQNLYVVHGRPGWSSQFLIATFNQNGRFSALRYEFFGDPKDDSWGCRAWSVEKETGQKLTGADITIGLSKKEQWYSKQGSKWQTMPQQMLMYRAASWFIRAYAPEIAMGLRTVEEAYDIGPGEFNVTDSGKVLDRIPNEPPPASKLDALVDAAKPAAPAPPPVASGDNPN